MGTKNTNISTVLQINLVSQNTHTHTVYINNENKARIWKLHTCI